MKLKVIKIRVMRLIELIIDKFRVKTREKILNPILNRKRRMCLKNQYFTIISNNCWGGHVYRFFGSTYDSPTVGLYFFSEDYVKFVSHLKEYLDMPLKFITYRESRYRDILETRGGRDIQCPIGVLNDIEIIFLHYYSQEEALEKWTRRKSRIHWDNIIIKMSEQNLCKLDHLKMFDSIHVKKKLVFTTKDYGLESQVIFGDYLGKDEVSNDTLHFRKYVDLIKLINGLPFRKHQPKIKIHE